MSRWKWMSNIMRSLLDRYRLSEYTFMFHRKSETMDIVNAKSRWYASYVICDAMRWRHARDEVSLVDTCRDSPSMGRISNDESEHERELRRQGFGGADVIWGRWGRGRGESPSCTRSSMKFQPRPREDRPVNWRRANAPEAPSPTPCR